MLQALLTIVFQIRFGIMVCTVTCNVPALLKLFKALETAQFQGRK